MIFTAIVVKNKISGEIIDIYPIGDVYDEVYVWYPAEYVGSIENIQQSLEKWPVSTLKDAIFGFVTTGGFDIHEKAIYCPSIGNVQVLIERRSMSINDWNKLPIER